MTLSAAAPSAWLAVVSADHVERGVQWGIVQTNHGKRSGLARMRPGDLLVYYSPHQRLGERSPVQAFTAIGRIADDRLWQAEPDDPAGCFRPWRRRVDYRSDARHVRIAELRRRLELTAEPNWGYRLRRGLVPISWHDLNVIHEAMTGEPAADRSGARAGGPSGLW